MLTAMASVASAEIFEWTDAAGVVHFTNLESEVPVAVRGSAQVIVDETARRPSGAAEAPAQDAAPPAVAAPADPSQAQQLEALYERTQWLNGYLQGLESGLNVGPTVASGGSVEVNGPLVVDGTSAAPYAPTFEAPYPYGCAWPYSYWCDWPVFYPGIGAFRRPHVHHVGPFHPAGPFRPRAFAAGRIQSVSHMRPRF